MTRRPASWQQEKQRTAKALRELPKCDYAECNKRAFGIVMARVQCGDGFKYMPLHVCPTHAQREQRAQRERRT